MNSIFEAPCDLHKGQSTEPSSLHAPTDWRRRPKSASAASGTTALDASHISLVIIASSYAWQHSAIIDPRP